MRKWRPLMVTVTCAMTHSLVRYTDSTVVGLQDGADGVDCGVEPARDLAVGGVERPGPRRGGVEIGGEQRAIGTERMQLRLKRLLAAIGVLPALDRRAQRIEGERKAPGRRVDRLGVVHRGENSGSSGRGCG